MNMFEPQGKSKIPPNWMDGIKLKAIKNMRIVGLVSMLIGYFSPWKMIFWLGLMVMIMSYQISVEKWERYWAKLEKEKEAHDSEKAE